MKVHSYRELIAWQKAIELVVQIYKITSSFPADERFGLTSQIRRAAVSIPSNIAEGQGRGPSNDFIRFLGIARGSLQEVDTQLDIAARLGLLGESICQQIANQIVEVAKLINGLARSIPT